MMIPGSLLLSSGGVSCGCAAPATGGRVFPGILAAAFTSTFDWGNE